MVTNKILALQFHVHAGTKLTLVFFFSFSLCPALVFYIGFNILHEALFIKKSNVSSNWKEPTPVIVAKAKLDNTVKSNAMYNDDYGLPLFPLLI